MDHSWRPRPIQGNNICPTCSVSHFPFCPSLPHPSRYPGPNIEPNRGPINMGRPVYNKTPDPYHDPGYWNRNPNPPIQMGTVDNVNGGVYAMQGYGYDYSNSYNNNVNNDDRSSKRLRVDGGYPGSYGGESDPNGGLRRYPEESLGFDRMTNKVGMGNGGNYQKEGYEYGSRYGLGNDMNRSVVSDVEHGRLGNEYQCHDHPIGMYGNVAKQVDPGSFSHGGFRPDNDSHSQSYGYRPPNYGSNFEHMQSNGAALHYDSRNNLVRPDQYSSTHSSFQPGHMGYGHNSPRHFGGERQTVDSRQSFVEGYQSVGNQHVPTQVPFEPPHMSRKIEYGNAVLEHLGPLHPPQRADFQPPLPLSPPPPLPMEPPAQWSTEHQPSFSPKKESPSFPVHSRSSAALHYSHSPTSDSHVRGNPHLDNLKIGHGSRGTFQGDSQGILTTLGQYSRGNQALPSKNNLPDKPRTVDIAHLFRQPHRTSRPDHFVIILRGLPGSGKSYFAKMLRDLELEHGGNAPRIHSMDDYFMTEVEKTEENEASKSSARGKKPVTKTVIEYCYEPEMEEAYRLSMLKSFKKTLEEGVYTFVIVDDRNLRVADFAQFWATAKRSGYEVYVLEAPYKDPAGCTARNVHGFSQEEVEKMAALWEEAPSLYLQLDVKSLLHGDDLKEGNIEEVDMDTEDGDSDPSLSNEKQAERISLAEKSSPDASPKDKRNLDAEPCNRTEKVKDLGQSKWSDNLDDDDDERSELLKGKANVLSGLLGTYGKEGKSVHWGDQAGRSGFSIGAIKKAKMASLVIGPGTGYNLKSNPLPEEDTMSGKSKETKKHSAFKERLQAEQESFRAVFDRRRHRIGFGGVLTEKE
ncbi:hypothetical protein KSS87_002627 [Heliosperma pusillum]|nr:hypothetical protein KSS87_002627 [Heliosperma pusillum]